MKPTKEVAQALVNLRVSHDFEVVIEWLRSERKTARDECENQLDHNKALRSQGKSICLKDILETNESAPELLSKLKN